MNHTIWFFSVTSATQRFSLLGLAFATNALIGCLLVAGTATAGFTTLGDSQKLSESGPAFRFHLLSSSSSIEAPGSPLVVLLGGGPGFSSWNLEPIQKRLHQAGHSVVVMDMIGIGENAEVLNQLSGAAPGHILPIWIRQIRALHQASGERPLILVGHSWGALMAMLYTRAYPEEVKQWVLLNPVDPERKAMQGLVEMIDQRRSRLTGQTDRTKAWDDWPDDREESRSEGSESRLAERQLIEVLPTYFADMAQGRRYAAQFDAGDFRPGLNVQAWQEYAADPIGYDWIRNWHNQGKRRVDFIECDQDYFMPTNLRVMRANMTLDSVTVLKACAHFPWVEQPQAFYPALLSVLKQP
ncbi:MAG: alpha/beta hydrolase [Hydrogenovibrio sp.]|uniref:alpha/beta fold hydrolase n=1 Tax=Hydrogenovibrio sp. TaxID=2065821 RepID=UPI00287066CA|nr:alpha/beta hydrolase [Hydrogenovibrio sp.]MDR9499156.1 alpha/beta hydrolase [Hydrogenovibrio sp.]